jgi:transcriptional regulator with XRE-family HTH domain
MFNLRGIGMDSDELKELGRRVRELRHVRGWTQTELAARMGVKQSAIGKIERGESDIPVTALTRLADALGVAPGSLLRRPPRVPGRKGE